MSLRHRLTVFKANFEAGGPPYYAPSSVPYLIHRATDELVASGAASRALKAGEFIPDFNLLDSHDRLVCSEALLARGPLLITFFRGVWCPYCNLELQALQASLSDIERDGATLIAISPQLPEDSRRAQRDNNFSFTILSDPHNEVAAAFGLRFKLPGYLVELYKNVFKTDGSWTLPMPARFVVAQDGMIVYAEVNPDYTDRPDPHELLPALDKACSLSW